MTEHLIPDPRLLEILVCPVTRGPLIYDRERGELIWLEHGEERRYDTVLRILPDAAAVTDAVARIERVARQPEEEYPQPTGNFPAIPGRTA